MSIGQLPKEIQQTIFNELPRVDVLTGIRVVCWKFRDITVGVNDYEATRAQRYLEYQRCYDEVVRLKGQEQGGANSELSGKMAELKTRYSEFVIVAHDYVFNLCQKFCEKLQSRQSALKDRGVQPRCTVTSHSSDCSVCLQTGIWAAFRITSFSPLGPPGGGMRLDEEREYMAGHESWNRSAIDGPSHDAEESRTSALVICLYDNVPFFEIRYNHKREDIPCPYADSVRILSWPFEGPIPALVGKRLFFLSEKGRMSGRLLNFFEEVSRMELDEGFFVGALRRLAELPS